MANKQLFLKELKARYKQLYDAVQPIPYIRDRLYCVDRVFVEVGIEYLAESWILLDSYHFVFRESLTKSYRRILIGEPGYGKSTLTLQYAYDWCNGVQKSYLKNVEILILLRLRQLRGVASIYRAIKRFILSSRCQISEKEIQSIISNSSSVVVILDGFDEYPDEDANPKTDIMKIIHSEKFRDIEVVITTRYPPKGISSGSKRLQLIGFDERARDEYIQKAVVGSDLVAANRIKQRLEKNPVLGDLCQVPLFFVMFAHMSHEDKDFQTFKTVTSFFQYMIKCFHRHMKNKMDDPNVQMYHMYENSHHELNEVAFEGLSKPDQQIVWSRLELVFRLGKDFYDQYIRVGILVEEEAFDCANLHDSSYNPDKVEVRFYHKIFCEWYAAHYLVSLVQRKPKNFKNNLRNMDPLDVQYCYRFACGLNPTAAGSIIEYVKQSEGGDQFAILCILEQGGRFEGILDTVKNLCGYKIVLKEEGNKLLQRSTVQLLEIASSSHISISCVFLYNCYSTVDLRGGNHLQLKSNLSIPVLTTLNKLWIKEEGREITPDEFTGILQYSSKCLALQELLFCNCLLPPSVQAESVSFLTSRNVKVLWGPCLSIDYQLNVQSCLWEHIDGTQRVIGVMTDDDYQEEMSYIRHIHENTEEMGLPNFPCYDDFNV